MAKDQSGVNSPAFIHGGEAAIQRMRRGEPFEGILADLEADVIEDLGIDLDKYRGVDRICIYRAIQFEVASRCFFQAGLAAAAVGDLDHWDAYIKRLGWIGSKALYAMKAVRDIIDKERLVIDYEKLLSERLDDEDEEDDVEGSDVE